MKTIKHTVSPIPAAPGVSSSICQEHVSSASLLHAPIAIIGIGCRFPGGVHNPATFWQLLCNAVDAIGPMPPDRYAVDAYYATQPGPVNKIATNKGGFLEHIDQFDADFFGIAPREANLMDPQQRLLLEVAWEALEDGGQAAEKLTGSHTGVFIGMWTNEYEDKMFQASDDIDLYMTTGGGRYAASGRLSFAFDFRGPSLTLDTGCSSALVAIHLACQSLRQGESTLALAGGVNLLLEPQITIGYSGAKMLAPDACCKFGDARANGYVRSEGVGLVVLKPAAQALADGDPIYALIRGSAVNNDGRSSDQLKAPGVSTQAAMLRQAYQDAGVSPGQVSYVEAHGTGTSVGDPVEIQALGLVLATDRPPDRPCLLGSVKTNIGHTEAAAGVAGLIKTVLALRHRVIPANLHFQTANPAIPWAELPVQIPQTRQPWPDEAGPALAGVSSFGITGTNAHLVLQEAPAGTDAQPAIAARAGQAALLPLSARSPAALQALIAAYQTLLASAEAPALTDLCYTASVRRAHHDYRAAFVATSHADLAEELSTMLQGEGAMADDQPVAPVARKVAFVFPGQGSQWLGMGCQLLACEPAFRAMMEACDAAFRPYVSWSLLAELQAPAATSRLAEIDVVQPALFAIQVSLAALWRAWGVAPDAVIGHSLGEVAAAYVAGALHLADAAKVICRRSQLMKEMAGQGAMAVLELGLAEAQQAISGYADLAVAVSNSPRSTVVAGDPDELQALLDELAAKEIFCRRVNVDVAAHSTHMEPLKPRLVACLAGLQPLPITVPLYSTVTGQLHTAAALDETYWGDNLRQPVLFATALQAALAAGCNTFIEISPHPVLIPAIEQGFAGQPTQTAATLATLASGRRKEDEQAILLQALGKLYTLGYPVEWARRYPAGGRYVSVPTYPWQRERFWLDDLSGPTTSPTIRHTQRDAPDHPLLGWPLVLAGQDGRLVWENVLDRRRLPQLFAHQVGGTRLLPASAYVGMAMAAAQRIFGGKPYGLTDFVFQRPLIFTSTDAAPRVQISLTPTDAAFAIQIYSQAEEGQWLLHVTGQLALTAEHRSTPSTQAAFNQQMNGETTAATKATFYQHLAARGIDFGPPLQQVSQVWYGDGEARATLASFADDAAALLCWDPCFQLTAMALPSARSHSPTNIYLPARFANLQVYAPNVAQAWSYVRTDATQGQSSVTQDLVLADAQATVLAELHGLQLLPLGQVNQSRVEEWLYKVDWQRKTYTHQRGESASRVGHWLIFADQGGIGVALANRIQKQGGKTTLVYPGPTFSVLDVNRYQLKPDSAADMQQLFHAIFSTSASTCQGILYGWGMDAAMKFTDTDGDIYQTNLLSLTAVLQLCQSVAGLNWSTKPRLWVMTQGAQPVVTPLTGAALVQSPLWGWGRVVQAEHPELWGGLIDLDPDFADGGAADQLVADLLSPDGEDQLAFYGGQRYVARLIPRPQPAKGQPALRWRRDASYLITGGLGTLGLAVAALMVAQGTRRLILMARTPLPPRSEWHSLDPASPAGAKVAAIRALECQGATIHVAAVDVADEGQLTTFLDQYRQEGWPSIRGVIHTAGTMQNGLLTHLTPQALNDVLRAKIRGGWLLHQHLKELDCFISFSSISSIIGYAGVGNYAAANAFLDALAHYRQGQGQSGLSINWGVWADSGMVKTTTMQQVAKSMQEEGFHSFSLEQGVAALQHLLQHNEAGQIAVAAVDWTQYRAIHGTQQTLPFFTELIHDLAAPAQSAEPTAPAADSFRQQLFAGEASQRPRRLTIYLQEQVGKILQRPPARIAPHKPLGSLGLDSLMGLELRNRLERALGLALSATLVWNYPTVAELTTYLLSKLDLPAEAQLATATPASITAAPLSTLSPAQPVAASGQHGRQNGKLSAIITEVSELSDVEVLQRLTGQQ